MNSLAGKILFAAVSVLYPVLVFCGLCVWNLSPRKLSLFLLLLAAVHLISTARGKSSKGFRLRGVLSVAFLSLCAAFAFAMDDAFALKFYPVLVNAALLVFFGATLVRGPSLAFRLAAFADKRIPLFADRLYVESYCFRVTAAWCVFFVANGSIALWTVLFADGKIWSLYNGLVAYILMGIFFAVEFGVRKMKRNRLHVYIPFSQIRADSRPDDSVVCFGGTSVFDGAKTWADFKADVSRLRSAIEREKYDAWILNAEDIYCFLVAVFALFQSQRKILFSANRQPEFIREIRTENVGFLNDCGAENSLQIPQILETFSPEKAWEPFDAKNARASLFTSGTTGAPKEIAKNGSQFENEANALAQRFERGFAGRAFYTTVNHHHIYGMAFGVFVPISAGLPIRRARFEFPEELERIVRERAVIVSSPAFLKRLVYSYKKRIPFAMGPFWLSAGGALPDDVARGVETVSGSRVQEIYGCSEAGAMATRRFGEDRFFSPIPSNRIALAENGCLKIQSPYADSGCFVTGDLGTLNADGSFCLHGRADTIVKIEEKRISLLEVENRLRRTGVVRDARVVPMSGKRQYLAAAIVLNDGGMEKFRNIPKRQINEFFKSGLLGFLENTVLPKRWRYLEELPQDAMGKIRTRDIVSLFEIPESPNFRILKYDLKGDRVAVKIVIPASSDYYDGHFPEFKLLPAVAQVDLVLRLFRGFSKKTLKFKRISRTKFMGPIFPDKPFFAEYSYLPETGKLSFKLVAEDGKSLSAGTVEFEKDAQ